MKHYSKTSYKAGYWKGGNYVGKTSNSISNTTTSTKNYINNDSSFNIFDEKETKWMKERDAKGISKYINVKMYKYNSSPKQIKDKKLAEYLHSIFIINPKQSFSVVMKVNGFNKEVMAKLPKHVQTFFRDRGRGIIKGYNEYMKKKGN